MKKRNTDQRLYRQICREGRAGLHPGRRCSWAARQVFLAERVRIANFTRLLRLALYDLSHETRKDG